ncbi:unnamed protein product [Protopolystoma xenopodis]|uniref:Ubiquitin conjugation factor E4 core domain-containing protein n=1 Tax=Protopolystoma xenopodis TaxID=117903 RepID=A0A3S5ADF1_9PLAT|nr:unnamed protein product [Protopolystoma xenopodis]
MACFARDSPPPMASSSASVSFSTECFFLTAWATHTGLLASLRKLQRRQRAIDELQRNVDQLEASRVQWASPNSPPGKTD